MTTTVDDLIREQWAQLKGRQGFTNRVVSVRVRNVGRMPVTVEGWGLVARPTPADLVDRINANRARGRGKLAGGTDLSPVGDGSLGPALPFRLEAGASETWSMKADSVSAFVSATKVLYGDSASVVGYIELGDGRTIVTREIIPATRLE